MKERVFFPNGAVLEFCFVNKDVIITGDFRYFSGLDPNCKSYLMTVEEYRKFIKPFRTSCRIHKIG